MAIPRLDRGITFLDTPYSRQYLNQGNGIPKTQKVEIGNHNLDGHCSHNFHHPSLLNTQIDGNRIEFHFGTINIDNSFSNYDGLYSTTNTDETIRQMVE